MSFKSGGDINREGRHCLEDTPKEVTLGFPESMVREMWKRKQTPFKRLFVTQCPQERAISQGKIVKWLLSE